LSQTEHTPERWRQVQQAFHDALATSDDQRASFLELHCCGDPELLAEVRSLLSACEAQERAVESWYQVDPAWQTGTVAGRRIGPYDLEHILGRGGVGAVYLAHRADGQFDQRLAIKLIDLPLATDLFRQRFRLERQILAGLNHPNIARLLDGGATEDGELYLAMEYVEGIPIDSYCDQQCLDVPARLSLFKRICSAVQYAHQNLVVHRDLKPANILVLADSTPKLLDFGTAKLLAPFPANAESESTRQGFHSFTPQYASPEQVLGAPITTASDTYSLGVLLYLLLTGSPPYELKEFTTAEMLRVICERQPDKPSTHSNPAIGPLDADLDAIILKALRKEPQDRYLTVDQFAGDIQAYLDGRPVAARHGTFRYQAGKFIRRNRLGLVGAGLLAFTLVAGLAGVLWQARVANTERRKAEARSADLRQLSNSLLSELDEAIKQLPGSTGVQKLLVTRVLEHLDRMAIDAQGDRQTRLDLVDAYTRLGNIQGNVYDQNLGDPAGALASLAKALALAETLAASDPNDRDALRALATVQQSRSEVLFGASKTQDAVASMREAARTYDKLIAGHDATPVLICEAAAAYGTLGDELGQSGTPSLADTSAALAAYRKTIALDNRALAIDSNFLRAKRGLGIMQMKVGSIELETDPAQALTDFQTGLQRFKALPPSDQSSLTTVRMRAHILRKEALALKELEEYSQAVPLFEEAAQIFRRLVAEDPKDLRALADLAVVLEDEASNYEDAANPALTTLQGDRRRNLLDAERVLEQASAANERLLKQDPGSVVWKSQLANQQVRIGTIREILHAPGNSETLAKTGLTTLKDLAEKDQASPSTLNLAVSSLVTVEPASLRNSRAAVAWAEREVALSVRRSPAGLLSLAQAYRSAGEIDRARATANEGLALLPPLQPGATKPRIRKLLELEARHAV
jgi:tetratricopeptide (TPR) repeat protein